MASHTRKNSNNVRRGGAQTASWFALGAIADLILFTFAWIVLGILRPGYSQVGQQISDLSLGSKGPLMSIAFVIGGALLFVSVIGILRALRGDIGTVGRWACAVLLFLPPAGQIMDGIFSEAEATKGFHALGAALAFLSPIIGFLVAGLVIRHSPRWRRIGNRLLLAIPFYFLTVVAFFLTGPPGAKLASSGLGGLTERVMVMALLAVYAGLGLGAWRRCKAS